MAEKTAQERYADVRKSLVEVGQHGIAWQLDQVWLAARKEAAAEQVTAVDAALVKAAEDFAKLDGSITAPDESLAQATLTTAGAELERIKAEVAARIPGPSQDGEGGGASSQAGVESKEPLPGGVIA